MATDRDWRNLPDDLIGVISMKLQSTFDYVRFRSVCPSWRSAAPRRPLFPWLYQECTTHAHLYDLFSTNHICVPPLLRSYPIDGPSSYGSALGWFIFMNVGSDFSLRNPLTGARILLPDHPDLLGTDFIRFTLSSDPAGGDCQVIVYGNDMYEMFHCRIGDHTWTKLPVLPNPQHLNILFYKGKFYAVSGYKVFVCEFEPEARMTEILPAHQLFSDSRTLGRLPFTDTYLVVSSGDLLLVAITYRKTVHGTTSDEFGCDGFEVFRVVFNDQLSLHKLHSLGGSALFLCPRSMPVAVPVPAANSRRLCRGNCIYFIFNNLQETYRITIFSMVDDRIRNLNMTWRPDSWFTPSLCKTL